MLRGRAPAEFDETVIREAALEILLNGKRMAVQWRTPGHDHELAAGFLFTAGYLPADAFVQGRVTVTDSDSPDTPGAAAVDVSAPEELLNRNPVRIFTPDQAEQQLPAAGQGVTVRAEKIWDMHDTLRAHQDLWNATGGAHAAGLFSPDAEPVVMREDVGRHNALDKVLGHALMQGADPAQCVLALSSRASFEMALKAVRAGVSVVACVSAATSSAVALCRSRNITIAGFTRKHRMVVYTHPHRIVSAS